MPEAAINSNDYYSVLGISRDADDKEIQKAYKKLALKWHPDKNKDNKEAEQNFKKVSEAYSVLSDKSKRQSYDMYGKDGVNGGAQFSEDNAARIFQQFFGASGPGGGTFTFEFSVREHF